MAIEPRMDCMARGECLCGIDCLGDDPAPHEPQCSATHHELGRCARKAGAYRHADGYHKSRIGGWRVPKDYVTKDSGQRKEYASGMRRDIQEGKPRFDLIFPEGVPYEDQLLTRFAGLLERGATKYGENNWQLANSDEEMRRFRASGLRHMIQWACGETDEDHATAVIFNIMAYENTKRKIDGGSEK